MSKIKKLCKPFVSKMFGNWTEKNKNGKLGFISFVIVKASCNDSSGRPKRPENMQFKAYLMEP